MIGTVTDTPLAKCMLSCSELEKEEYAAVLPITPAPEHTADGERKLNMRRIMASLTAASTQVDALGSLASALVAGLHAGTVDPDHIEALIGSTQQAIQLHLNAAAEALTRA